MLDLILAFYLLTDSQLGSAETDAPGNSRGGAVAWRPE
jgi:hypothetical protein